MKITIDDLSFGKLDFLVQQIVEGFMIGLHKSPFHGFSVEFKEHRSYNLGDNLRYIDWKVFAKKEQMFVKTFEEETNLRCAILIDQSSSMNFKSQHKSLSKFQYACVVSAAIAKILSKQLDAFGWGFMGKELDYLSPIKTGPKQYQQLIQQLEAQMNGPLESLVTADLGKAIHQVASQIHKRSLIVVMSDFRMDEEALQAFKDALIRLKHQKQEIILFELGVGQIEWGFDLGDEPLTFVDMESGQKIKAHPNAIKENYLTFVGTHRKAIKEWCLQQHIDLVNVDIEEDVSQILYQYLLKRNKMM